MRRPAPATSFAGPILGALLAGILAAAPCAGADRPSATEWTPVEQAIAADAADAQAKLSAITAAYPKWPDGFRALAQLQVRHRQMQPALISARAALALAPDDAAAASSAVQALAGLGQVNDAYSIANQFTGAKDTSGWVNFYAAVAALEAKDRAKAELYLSLAMARVKDAPPEFTYLDARIAELSGDLPRAEASLKRAIAASPRFWDAWHELGVVQARLADAKPDMAIDLLTKSEAAFRSVASANEQAFESWQGLGCTQLKLAQVLMPGSESDGRAKARDAITSLGKTLALKEAQRDAQLALGQALLIDEQYEPAISHLQRARELGATERALDFNLMLAYQKAGKTAEFERAAASIKAESPSEKITTGMGLYHAGNFTIAAQLLASAATDLGSGSGSERERIGAVDRFVGHAQSELADRQRRHLAEVAESERPAAQAELERLLDAARDSYRAAGALADYPAQHHFLALETARGPRHGYDAGWQYLAWNSYTSPGGWAAVIGNYGGAMTDGRGVAGMWEQHPAHVVAWGVLAVVPFLIFLTSLFRRQPEVVTREERASRAPTPEPRAPQPRPAAPPPPKPQQRTPAPKPGPSAALERRVEQRPERRETEPAARNQTAPTRATAPRQVSGEHNALERRIDTPRPGAGRKSDDGHRRPPKS